MGSFRQVRLHCLSLYETLCASDASSSSQQSWADLPEAISRVEGLHDTRFIAAESFKRCQVAVHSATQHDFLMQLLPIKHMLYFSGSVQITTSKQHCGPLKFFSSEDKICVWVPSEWQSKQAAIFMKRSQNLTEQCCRCQSRGWWDTKWWGLGKSQRRVYQNPDAEHWTEQPR